MPDKQTALSTQPLGKLRQEILIIAEACARLKIRERGGANRGREVEAFLRWAGGQPGQPWCMAFVDFVYELACLLAGCKAALDPGLSCSKLASQALRLKRLHSDPLQLYPGDLVLLRGGPTGYKHVGIVVEVLPRHDGSWDLITIEGNTNEAGSAEGDGVYRKLRRPDKTPMAFIRVG